MSLSIDPKNGVRVKTSRKPGRGIAALIIVLEAVFSVFLYMSLAERVFVVIPAAAQPGVPELISYQGMLTDSSGNPLGGAGSIYCFRYSIWDSQSGGSQLWPQPALGDASTTPTNSTTTVEDGVFSDELGRTDTFGALDFGANTTGSSTYYLQVQVSTSSLTCASGVETLSPRQQITSDAWSQTAQSVYGSQLRTLISNNTVQIGTGSGVISGWTLLSLDVAHGSGESVGGSCSPDGTLWYDSTLKKALVCVNSTIQSFSNGTSTINSIGTNGTTTLIASGEALFSASANITITQSGNTLSFSVAPPGATLEGFEPFPFLSASTGFAPGRQSWYFQPFVAPQTIGSGRLNILISNSNSSAGVMRLSNGASFASNTTGTVSISYTQAHSAALYSLDGTGANSTLLSSFWSNDWSAAIAESISVTSTTSAGPTTWVGALVSVTATYILHMDASGNVTTSSWSTNGSQQSNATNMATNVFTTILSNAQNSFVNQLVLPIPFNTSISAGQYWMAFAWNSASTTGGTAVPDVLPLVSQYVIPGGAEQSFRLYGQTTSNASSGIFPGLGVYSAASASPPGNPNLTQMNSVASNPIQYFNIINQSF